jgi:hypothetical protein
VTTKRKATSEPRLDWRGIETARRLLIEQSVSGEWLLAEARWYVTLGGNWVTLPWENQ